MNNRIEKHIIKSNHYLYDYCDSICSKTKNLYNYSNYLVRQEFTKNNKWLRYGDLDKLLKESKHFDNSSYNNPYRELPIQTSQQTLRLIEKNWKSFFKAIKVWTKNKDKFKGRPKLPNYKNTKNGKSVTIFTNQQCKVRDGVIKFPKSKLSIKTKVTDNLQQVRIVPIGYCYKIEIIYKVKKVVKKHDNGRYLGIDLGLNNFITMVNNIGLKPIIVNGKILKSQNQYFNKRRSEFMSYVGGKGISKRILKLTHKRNNKILDYIHKSSRYVVDYCIDNNINTIVIGKNDGWKQDINIGKRNNQNFVSIPFNTIINQILYKCEDVGINLIIREESYTSKCSFLDNENIKKHNEYVGKRIKRGLFRSGGGILINADVNGAYNILKKEFPKTFVDGIEGVVLHPLRVSIT